MKKNKKILSLRICSFFALVCFATITFSACGKSGEEKAGEPNAPDQANEEAAVGQSTQGTTYEQSTREELDESNELDKTNREEPGESKVFNQASQEAAYDQITQEEAKNLMDTEPDALILDVRTEEEYVSGHIPGAICIPNETIDDTITAQLPDKDQLILIYCRSGNRSKQASEKLVNLGYTNIKEFGGINTWSYEIE